MAETRRNKVDRILSPIPPYGQSLASDLNAEKFTQVTNWTHQGLLDQWKEEQRKFDSGEDKVKHTTTTCNAFTGWYGAKLGSTKSVGRFDIAQVFPKAWVAADSKGKKRPNYGDICRFKRYHVGVSLDFSGDTWNSVEGGQGGPSSKRDIVTRKKTKYTADLLQGWLDISKLDGVKIASPPRDEWLLGWWMVTWRNKKFFYLFEPAGRVKFTRTRPLTVHDPLLDPIDIGYYSLGRSVRILWKSTKSIEVLASSDSEAEMKGLWNGKVQLSAVKL